MHSRRQSSVISKLGSLVALFGWLRCDIVLLACALSALALVLVAPAAAGVAPALVGHKLNASASSAGVGVPWAGPPGVRSGQASRYPVGGQTKLSAAEKVPSAAVVSSATALRVLDPSFGPVGLARSRGAGPGPPPPPRETDRSEDAHAGGGSLDVGRLLGDPVTLLDVIGGLRNGVLCVPGPPTISVAPFVSAPAPAYSGAALTTSDGSWSSPCGAPPVGFQYEWLRNGVVIPSQTASAYTVQGRSLDVRNSIQSAVQ